ncbi:MAG TPA: metallophosphoesterase [Candidatus Nanoarchaeia archaeon]|nr:metallophosphoesterase [Candidatus Nanoarchaeia archaeon]
MEIHPSIEIIDLALYLRKHQALVISDVHIGYEEALQKSGTLVPHFQSADQARRIRKIISFCRKGGRPVTRIIITGDLKHEFGTISPQEWRETLRFLDILGAEGTVTLVRGNHDTVLGPIADKRNVTLENAALLGDILIIHGNRIPPAELLRKAKTIIMGHEHPAITIREGGRAERFKCYLKGAWKRKTLIVQPSFLLAVEGTDVLRERLLSPLLASIRNFEVFVVADTVYRFGRVRDIK